MGLFSSKKSTAVSTSNTVQTTNINAQTSGAGHVVAGSGHTVNLLDAGAVANALNFADLSNWRALWASDQANARSIDAVDQASARTIAAVDQASARALAFAEQTQADAAGLTLGLIDRYQDASAETLSKVLSETRAQSKESRDFALSAVRSETHALSESLLQYGGLALAAVAALLVLKG